MTATVGAPAPDFTLVDQDRNPVSLSDFAGHRTMVVFIPNPFTGVCEGEVCEIRDNIASLGSSDAKVVVITTHGMFTNKRWADELGIELVSTVKEMLPLRQWPASVFRLKKVISSASWGSQVPANRHCWESWGP